MTKANKERGAAAVEYGILAALIAGVVISGTAAVGVNVRDDFFTPISQLIEATFPGH